MPGVGLVDRHADGPGRAPDRPGIAGAADPPAIPLSKALQTARFVFRPLPFLEHWRRALGETFRASLFGPGDVVFLSDPESIKRLFTADRVNTIAPGRNIVLEPLLGSSSLLLQDDEEHLRRRKLMLPPFHGERMRGYEAVIREVTERTVAGWPRGQQFALHPSMQAITLEVILRAVFGVEDAARREDAAREPGRDPRRERLAGGDRLHRARGSAAAAVSPDRRASRPRRRAALRGDRRAPRLTPTSPSATTSSRCWSRRASTTARRWTTASSATS